MSGLPEWIEDELDDNDLTSELSKRHVVETMYEAERPVWTTELLSERIKPDDVKPALRKRLRQLAERDVVHVDVTTDGSANLYWIDYPGRSWPVLPESEPAAPVEDTPGALNLSLRQVIRQPFDVAAPLLIIMTVVSVLISLEFWYLGWSFWEFDYRQFLTAAVVSISLLMLVAIWQAMTMTAERLQTLAENYERRQSET